MTGIPLLIVFCLGDRFDDRSVSRSSTSIRFFLADGDVARSGGGRGTAVKIPGIIGSGFSGVFSSIGIVIILGALIGLILEKTGAAIRLADVGDSFRRRSDSAAGADADGLDRLIPVFCDSGFVILNPIRKALCRKLKGASPAGMAVALSAGLYAAHVFIPPTPGPIAAAGSLGLADHLAGVILAGVIASVPALAAAYIFSLYIAKKDISVHADEKESPDTEKSYEELVAGFGKLPGAFSSFAPIVIPVILMALGSFVSMIGLQGSSAVLCKFFATPIIALTVGLLLAVRLLVSTHTMNRFAAITDETLKTVGPILFVTAAGGVLGKVITAAGFVEFMKANAAFLSSVGIFFPFLISAILKTAQGSSTVAITTTAGIMGMYTDSASMMSALGLQSEMAALLTVMAIGAGAMTVSHANDSYFWVVTNFTGLDPQDGYRTQSMMTLVVGIVSMVSIFLASLVLL